MKMRTIALTFVVASVTAGCATGPDRKPGDPLEPMNRAIFKFNDTIDTAIAQPIAKGYQKVTPQPLRQAVSNFFSNLGDLGNAANNLLQLHITDATQDIMRFAMNTVFGVGGLLDFATPAGLPKHHQDFGLTLGRWGIPAGPYLVLPLFGPSSFRDSIGFAVDFRFNPLTYMEPAWRNPLWGLQFVSARADLLGASDLLSQAALDKYSFVRDAFTQQRRSLLRGSSGAAPAPLPDYGDPDAPDSGAAPASGASGAAAGLPDYSDPGDSAAAPPEAPASGTAGAPPANTAPASSGAPAAAPSDLPNHDNPGDSAAPASGNPGAAPSAGAAGTEEAPNVAPLPKPAVQ